MLSFYKNKMVEAYEKYLRKEISTAEMFNIASKHAAENRERLKQYALKLLKNKNR